jgi:hypothetical protein
VKPVNVKSYVLIVWRSNPFDHAEVVEPLLFYFGTYAEARAYRDEEHAQHLSNSVLAEVMSEVWHGEAEE